VSSSDLVIISFFGTNDFSTLSLLIFRLMGSYQIAESHAVSLFFLIYCFIYFIISYKLLSNLNMRIN
jgi:ABC-type Fe3+ transport system permease subunit